MDESDQFYANPLEFINTHFEPLSLIDEEELFDNNNSLNNNNHELRKWPSHLIIFEALLQDLGALLEKSNYNQVNM